MPPTPQEAVGTKRQRAARACDRCHRLGRKCRPGEVPQICQTCVDYGELCTYVRPQAKRGAPPRPKPVAGPSLVEHSTPEESTRLPSFLTLELILELLEIYKTTVYPIYCVFHWKSFEADVRRRRYEHDIPFQKTVLAVCAIAAARIRDGAWTETRKPTPRLSAEDARSVERAVVQESRTTGGTDHAITIDDARAAYLLAILGLQNGDYELLHTMMGRYLALSAILRLHDETTWPEGLTPIEVQERRVLVRRQPAHNYPTDVADPKFWSAYTTDVFIAMIWGGSIRHRDSKCLVSYPDRTLIEQDELPGDDQPAWIDGWNMVTDMYRVASLIMDDIDWQKSQRVSHGATHLSHILSRPSRVNLEAVWSTVKATYDSLPTIFQGTPELVGDFGKDVFGFQAANLKVTVQSVNMLLACSGEMSMTRRCDVAGELLDALADIPTVYMRMISVPFLHQLATIGGLLGSVVQGPLTISTYIQVRQILLSFSNLVSNLETSFRSSAHISEKLVKHVERIDGFMAQHGLPCKPTIDLFQENPRVGTRPHATSAPGRSIESSAERYGETSSPIPHAARPPSDITLSYDPCDSVNSEVRPSAQPQANTHVTDRISLESLESMGWDENTVVELPDPLAESWCLDWSSFFAPVNSTTDMPSMQGTGLQTSAYNFW